MGLAVVELVLAVEHCFGVEIPDSKWKELETPAALVAYLRERVPMRDGPAVRERRAFDLLRRSVLKLEEVVRERVTPSTRILDLLPDTPARQAWRQLGDAVGSRHWPRLQRSTSVSVLIGIVAAAAAAAGPWLLVRWNGWLAAAAALAVGWSLGMLATRALVVHPPPGFETLADAARTLSLSSEYFGGANPGWTEAEIEADVIALVRTQLAPAQLDMNTRFADLGC